LYNLRNIFFNEDATAYNKLIRHEDYDDKIKKWFCSDWLSRSDWLDIHGYEPKKLSENALEEHESDDK
jgi:hypothetical protein